MRNNLINNLQLTNTKIYNQRIKGSKIHKKSKNIITLLIFNLIITQIKFTIHTNYKRRIQKQKIMKTAIYSQKYNNQHNIYTKANIHGNNYPSTSNGMTKKSSTLKKFQHCISANTTQAIKVSKQNHYNFLNQLNIANNNFSISNNNSNTYVNQSKSKKPTQKPIQNTQKNKNFFINEYKKIISNLTRYIEYHEWILNKQIQKHDYYFNQIIKIVQYQKKQSRNYLTKQIKLLKNKIQVQKGALQNKIAQFQNNNYQTFQKQTNELQTQKYLEIPLFQVNLHNLSNLDVFKQQFKTFLFQISDQEANKQNYDHNFDDKQSIAETIELEESIKLQTKLYPNESTKIQTKYFSNQKESNQFQLAISQSLQLNQMTPIRSINQQEMAPIVNVDKKITNGEKKNPILDKKIIIIDKNLARKLEDEDLYCDQDMQNILKENKIGRKKKYQYRQETIPEESESHEDSFVVLPGEK